MQPLLKSTPKKEPKKKLKTPPGGGKRADTLFSYLAESNFPTFTLHQKETGFSLALEMEKLEETLRINRFKLIRNQQLRAASEELYDAAEIEIILQALIGIFAHAEKHSMDEILFILPQEEAIDISFFNGLFKEVTSINSGEEKRTLLSLPCSFQDYFLDRILDIKARICQELWVRQREDKILMNYLQNRYTEEFSLFQNIPLFEEQSSRRDTVIAFPIRAKRKPSQTSDQER